MSDRVYLHQVQKALRTALAFSKEILSEASLELKNMPIPPSLNCAYRNVAGKGRVLTRKALLWKYEMNAWALENISSLAHLVIMGREKKPMACECVFFFPRSDVYSIAGQPKALDPPNFQKLLIDHLCLYAKFDDSWFFRTEAEKAYGAQTRHASMSIRFIEARLAEDDFPPKSHPKSLTLHNMQPVKDKQRRQKRNSNA